MNAYLTKSGHFYIYKVSKNILKSTKKEEIIAL